MIKQVVVCTSETGFTKQYAGWIAEELGCEALSAKEWKKRKPSDYRTIIYGGGIYAGQIKGLKKIKEQMKKYPEVQLIVFGTGSANMDEKENIKKVIDDNLTQEERKKIPVFYLQSGLNYENMSLKYRIMMKMFVSMLRKKKDQSEAEKKKADMLAQSYDFCRKENIRELINYSENGGV